MRTIKFKAKVLENNPSTNPDNGWVEGFYYQDENKHFIRNGECIWEIDPETVCQFINLFDHYGSEVYENDIIYLEDEDIDNSVGYVCFDENHDYVIKSNSCDYHINTAMYGMIIGNRYDKKIKI